MSAQAGDQLLTIHQAAERLNCSPRVILKLVLERELAVVRFGKTARTLRIEQEELQRFIDQGGVRG